MWAIRDRFVSVAISREPEPPAFETPPAKVRADPVTVPADPAPGVADEPVTPPEITSVTGIGPVYATRLESAGVSTLSDLSGSSADEIASAAEVSVSRATDWIQQARSLL